MKKKSNIHTYKQQVSKVKETTMGKQTKSIMVVDSIPKGTTNKTKVLPANIMMNSGSRMHER